MRIRLTWVILALLIGCLTGCAASPDYSTTTIAIPDGYGTTFCTACSRSDYPVTMPTTGYCANATLYGYFQGNYNSMELRTYAAHTATCNCVFTVQDDCEVTYSENNNQ